MVKKGKSIIVRSYKLILLSDAQLLSERPSVLCSKKEGQNISTCSRKWMGIMGFEDARQQWFAFSFPSPKIMLMPAAVHCRENKCPSFLASYQKHTLSFRIVWSNLLYFWSCFHDHGSRFRIWGMLSAEEPSCNMLICDSHLYVHLMVLRDPSHFRKVMPSPWLERSARNWGFPLSWTSYWYQVSKLLFKKNEWTLHSLHEANDNHLASHTATNKLFYPSLFYKKSSRKLVGVVP